MCLISILLLIVGYIFSLGIANAELSAFEQTLQNDTLIETRESEEIQGGIRYRKVEFANEVFYFKFLSRQNELSAMECQTEIYANSPSLISGSVRTFKRTRMFVHLLKEKCETKNGQVRFSLDWTSPEFGFEIPDSKSSYLRKKRVYTNPVGGLPNAGFSAEFP